VGVIGDGRVRLDGATLSASAGPPLWAACGEGARVDVARLPSELWQGLTCAKPWPNPRVPDGVPPLPVRRR
jgi:hypothetical protein